MFEYGPFARFLAKYPQVRRVTTHMGAFGMESTKCTALVGDAPYLGQLPRTLTEGDGRGRGAAGEESGSR